MRLLWCVILLITTVKCQEQEKDKPDITLLSSVSDSVTHICVAGSNVDKSAITFITPLKDTYLQSSSVSTYVKEGKEYRQNINDCNFDEKCLYNWEINNNFNIKSSLDKNPILDPIIDKRWEKFPSFSTKMNSIKITPEKFNIGLSVRSRNEASILLCYADPKKCYWVVLNENKSQILRMCNNVDLDNFIGTEANCSQVISTIKNTEKSKNRWIHFFLSKSTKNHYLYGLQRFESEMNNGIVMNITTEEYNPINSIYLHLKGKGQWKYHEYSYLSLNQNLANGEWHNLGPNFEINENEICIELYAATCNKCSFSFGFNNEAIQEVPNKEKNHWYYMKIIVLQTDVKQNQLQIKANCDNCADNEGFWFIDDVRWCSINETRIIKLSTTEKDDVSCVALKYPQWRSENKGETRMRKICDNPMYIGQNCNISCTAVLGNQIGEHCNQNKICVPTEGSSAQCSCASGYYGKNCKDLCSQGFYGYNCAKVCEPCKKFCFKSSGNCLEGNKCQPNDDDKGCKISELLQILKAPKIKNATLTTITIDPNIKNPKNRKLKYQIEYMLSEDKNWTTYEEVKDISNSKITTIYDLQPSKRYNIRTVLYTENMEHNTKIYNHIYESELTNCINVSSNTIFYDNLKITAMSTKVIITWTPICKGDLEFNLSFTNNKPLDCPMLQFGNRVEIGKGVIEIPDIIPDTEYSLKITLIPDKMDTVTVKNEKFRTLESELPILRTQPKVISSDLQQITIEFNLQDIVKVQLVDEFTIQTRASSFGWKNNKIIKANGKLETKNTFKIDKLTIETKYDIRIVLFTAEKNFYDKCLPFAQAETVCHELSQHTLIENLSVESHQNDALIKWKPICRNKFNVIVKCAGDNWCKEPKKISTIESISGSFVLDNLDPYTRYEMEFSVANSTKVEKRNQIFRTESAAPPAVTELQVFSFSSNGISIRFKKPYPPFGELENYNLYMGHCAKINNHGKKSQNCDIWNEFQCITISQDEYYITCENYNIVIAAKNKNVTLLGTNAQVAFNSGKVTEPPVNLRIIEDQICWNHPIFVNGNLEKFLISYTQTESYLIMKRQTENNFQYLEASPSQKNYTYCDTIKRDLPLSSKYEISVRVISDKNIVTKSASKHFTTAPIQPKFIANITGTERTNTSQKIIIPAIDPGTQTNTSICYVAICDPTSKSENHLTLLHKELFLWSNCQGSFWIAAKLDLNDTKNTKESMEFTVGNETMVDNKALRPDVNYTISVLLVNEYDNKLSKEVYSLVTSAPELPVEINPALFFLLLLVLIVPGIGYFAYRRYKKPQEVQQPNTSFDEVPVQNNNIPRRNLVSTLSHYLPLPVQKNNTEPNEHDIPLINANPVYSKLVRINELSDYVKQSLENGELEKQHALFPKGGTKPWDYGMAKENKFKNRYNNLTAYNYSRVILDKIPGDPFSDFINANYIDGYKKSKAYIATQGPKISTVNDFWRMIWQENVTHIVMLANLEEGNKKKCEKYWPNIGTTRDYHNVSVTFTHSDIYADYEFRYFEARCNGEIRKIQQLHFTSWPDHGVPQYPQSLLPFLKKLLTVPTISPIVVHCSAGVGRTGTIILADICLRMAAIESQIDVLKYMQSIREQRANLVDNFDQYKLVHMVLLECLLAPETGIPCENLAREVQVLFEQGGLEKQMKYLEETAWHNQSKFNIKIESENMSKNRFPNIVPNVRRLYISRYPVDDEFSDYINAIPVDGFRFKDQFIVTQFPLPHTFKDFWRMISENNVKVIVALNDINLNDKTSCIFWPLKKGEQSNPVPYLTLTCQSIEEENKYNIFNINIQNSTENTELFVRLIQLKNWGKEQTVPENIETFIGVLEEAQNQSRKDPLVVTCYDGSTACGLFVALSFVIEKIKLEQICDVCQAVRTVRINRPQFISHQTQFEFLYRAAVHFVEQFADYSNFEGPRRN